VCITSLDNLNRLENEPDKCDVWIRRGERGIANLLDQEAVSEEETC